MRLGLLIRQMIAADDVDYCGLKFNRAEHKAALIFTDSVLAKISAD
jgi:hypothetical protein